MGGYREDLAEEFLLLSTMTYCNEASILNWTCKPCRLLDEYSLFNLTTGLTPDGIETKVLFLFSDAKQRVAVSFEGTHDPKELIDEIIQFTGIDYDIHSIPEAVAMYYFYNTYL